ncbi:MAG: hypothetical protein FJW39_27995 [Acidobacteria bacterium]|nr:hypothetical protein [Acidobacteriota bacterium]
MNRSCRILPVFYLLCFAQEDPAILAPPRGVAFPGGEVRVIVRADGKTQLKLDGKPVSAETPAEGVLTAALQLAPGAHEISYGAETVRVFAGPGPGAEFKPFRPHPPVANCTTCHAVKNGIWTFQRASLATVCSQCHAKDKFPAKHTHEMGILADCQICHDPHGSTAAAHMRKEKEAACKQCHN